MINEFDGQGSFQVALADIVIDKKYQPRSKGLDQSNLESLKSSDPSQWPSILVSPVEPNGKRSLISGFHRVQAAKDLGLISLKAKEVFPDLETAYEQNSQHGLQLSINERKRYALLLKERHPQMYQNEIARRVGLGKATVSLLFNGKSSATNSNTDISSNNNIDNNNEESYITSANKVSIEKRMSQLLDELFTNSLTLEQEKAICKMVVDYIGIVDGDEATDEQIEQGCQLIEKLIVILSTAISYYEIE